MDREEFLQGLTEALSGQVPPEVLQENLTYYRDYINTETGKGRTENQVMEELGSPRLIARTIIDTTPGAGEGAYEDYYAGRGPGSGSGSQEREDGGHGYGMGGGVHYYDLNKWYWKLIGLVIVIAVVALVLMVVGGILSLVIPMLPVIGLVILIMWFVRGGGPGSR